MSIYGYDPINQTETPLAGLAQVDDALSSTSENPVQNRVVTNALNNKANANEVSSAIQTLTNQVNILIAKESVKGSLYHYTMGSSSESFTTGTNKIYTVNTTLPIGKYIVIASIVYESQANNYRITDMYFQTTNNDETTHNRRFYIGQSLAIPTSSFSEIWNVTAANPSMSLNLYPTFTGTTFCICDINIIRIA